MGQQSGILFKSKSPISARLPYSMRKNALGSVALCYESNRSMGVSTISRLVGTTGVASPPNWTWNCIYSLHLLTACQQPVGCYSSIVPLK